MKLTHISFIDNCVARHIILKKVFLTVTRQEQLPGTRTFTSSIKYTSMADWMATNPEISRHQVARYMAEEKSRTLPRIRWSAESFIYVDAKDKADRSVMARQVMSMHTLPKGFRKEDRSWKIAPLRDFSNQMDPLAHVKDAIKSGARVIVVGIAKFQWSLLLAAVNVNSALLVVDYQTLDIIRLGHTNMATDACFEDKAATINKVLYANQSWRTMCWKLSQPIAEWDSITETSTPLENDTFVAPEVAVAPELPHWARSNRYNTRWTRYESKYTVKNQPVYEVDPAVNDWLDAAAHDAEDPLFNRARLEELTEYFKGVTHLRYDDSDVDHMRWAELGRLESAFGVISYEDCEESELDLPEWIRTKTPAVVDHYNI